jgi:hypothetical protein
MLYRTNREYINLSRVETFYKCTDSKGNDEYIIGLMSGREVRCNMNSDKASAFVTYWSWSISSDQELVQETQSKIDRLGLAISNAGYAWTDEMRDAYESSHNKEIKK